MSFVPHSQDDRRRMLEAIGIEGIEQFFEDVPEALRYPTLDLPGALSELEVLEELQQLGEENRDLQHADCFLGAGAYRHFIPSIVNFLASRSEFYTSYTPYQPEISQGTLQAMFEYQTMICSLTGMEVSNASHYDGATSTAEAVLMALNIHRQKRKRVLLSPTVHPQYRAVVRTYISNMEFRLVGDDSLANDLDVLEGMLDRETACLVVQTPDFLGRVIPPDRLQALAESAHDRGALLIVVANPVALGLIKPPGHCGVDIVTGEGQALGNRLNFGGPYLGFFACRQEHVRRSSGRIVGETVDAGGACGYVLTLNTREQHIRRTKATSNICTNQSLNALTSAIYLAALGRQGLRRVAELCYHKAHYAAQAIDALAGYSLLDYSLPGAPGPAKPGASSQDGRQGGFFHEFALRCPLPVAELNRRLAEEWGIIGGYDLGQDYPELTGSMLLCVTEVNSRRGIDRLVSALKKASEKGGV